MLRSRALSRLLLVIAVLSTAPSAMAQGRPDAATLLAAQREAMAKLSSMDGQWRGEAWIMGPDGQKHVLIQTERVGPFLDGALRVIEGRGYEADGRLAFNAFGTIAFDPAKSSYSLHSYAQGNTGDFPVTLTADGFIWEIAAGPMTIRYTTVIKDGVWTETGERMAPAQEPVPFFGMRLMRIGDTDWPAGGAVGPQ
jgi:hypothetical protein